MTVIGSKYRGSQQYQLVYRRLLTAAQRSDEVLYSDVATILGIGTTGHHIAREVGQVLGEISEDEHNAGRPMLTAIAVSVRGMPGDGFFNLARQLGRLSASDPAAEMNFWMAEERQVYQIWQQTAVARP